MYKKKEIRLLQLGPFTSLHLKEMYFTLLLEKKIGRIPNGPYIPPPLPSRDLCATVLNNSLTQILGPTKFIFSSFFYRPNQPRSTPNQRLLGPTERSEPPTYI